jgi:hypothetical protein
MSTLQILPPLIWIINKILGEEMATDFLNIIIKNEKFFNIEKIYDFQERKTSKHLILLLPGNGCEWAKKTGGCTMCALSQKCQEIGKNFSGNDLVSLCKIAIDLNRKKHPINLTIYNGGSFLNNREIPEETQLKICRIVEKDPSIKKLFIESRVEFIDEQKIKSLKKELKNKTLIIGIGLEAQDDKIRNTFIRKGLNKKDYEEKIKLLKENGVKIISYVFLKPIYLSEKEAIEEAIKTIDYAFKAGTDEVALEIAFIQEGTVMEKLFKENKYKPPWLWSVIEVIKKTYNLGPISVGGFGDTPPPIAISSNCNICSSEIKDSLQQYRETHDINLLNNLKCSCYKLYKKEIEIKL